MDYVNFLKSYGVLILIGLVLILIIISMIIKKNPLTEIIDSSITSELLELIIEAESRFGSGHGSEKLQFVVSSYVSKHPWSANDSSEAVVKTLVEYILSSPSKKKGVKH